MTDKERLIKLLKTKYDHYCDQCGVNKDSRYIENLADYLIANGVTLHDSLHGNRASVQEWVPVTERLPERDGQYLCNYHFGEERGMTFTRVLDYYTTDKIPHFQHTLGDTTMKVTHWMPLPELPKENKNQ